MGINIFTIVKSVIGLPFIRAGKQFYITFLVIQCSSKFLIDGCNNISPDGLCFWDIKHFSCRIYIIGKFRY